MFGDQPLSGQISLLKPLQNSLGFNDTVASTIERLDQTDTLYEGARGAASAAKKVPENWSRYPSKPTCSDTEIVRYFREDMMSDWGRCGGGSGAEGYLRVQNQLRRWQM
jgi:hypothetical protein